MLMKRQALSSIGTYADQTSWTMEGEAGKVQVGFELGGGGANKCWHISTGSNWAFEIDAVVVPCLATGAYRVRTLEISSRG